MTNPNPEHLLQQADRLITRRQTDLRRAVSSTYYAMFHFVLTYAADMTVGVRQRGTARYSLVYRSVEHRALRNLCVEIAKPVLTSTYRRVIPTGTIERGILDFSGAVVDLQSARHLADYDPTTVFEVAEVRLMVNDARLAIRAFGLASPAHRDLFLTLLLFPPR